MVIDSFQGVYKFLSNFYPVKVKLDGVTYPSVEHAYQAAKTLIPSSRARIRGAATASEAKRIGKTVTLRHDWEEVKLDVMEKLLRQKFSKEPLRTLLLKTGEAELIERNWWHDTFWGVCNKKGENHLGRILMKIRSELRRN